MGRFRRRPVDDPDAGRERFNFTRDIIEDLAVDAFRPAFLAIDGEGVIDRRTFRELADGAGRWSALLRTYGLEPGERLLVHLGNSPAWPAVLLGALKGGIVAVSCPETASTGELDVAAVHSGAKLAVTDRAHEPPLAAVRPDLRRLLVEDVVQELRAETSIQPTRDTIADDVAMLVYNGADPDRPTATSFTHAYTSTLKEQAEHWLDVQPRDIVWCSAPTGSPLSIRALFGPMSRGAAVILQHGPLEPDEQIELIERLGVTVLCWTPEELRRMAEGAHHAGVLPHLRLAVSEGASLDPDAAAAFRDTFRVSVRDGSGYGDVPVMQAVVDGPSEEERRLEAEAREAESVLARAQAHAEAARAQVEAEDARRLAAAQAREAENRRKADERAAAAQAKEDERRQKDEQKAAAAGARQAEEAARNAARSAAREAEQQRKANEAEARRLAAVQAKDEERRSKAEAKAAAVQAKEIERSRKAEEKAAAEEARRAEEAARNEARETAREAERRRKADEAEARLVAASQATDEERRSKAEQAQEAERRRADEQERKDAAQRARKASESASPAPAPNGWQNRDGAHEPEPVHDSPLVRRLQAYGRNAKSPDSVAPAE